ncbi:hypothetical protein EDB85DRAFT_1897870 [Lactarius pseudohatsudake]|nr:hypothetical protein EDB85DRAFT_1897870 [Lactarius pseudohatsudake]
MVLGYMSDKVQLGVYCTGLANINIGSPLPVNKNTCPSEATLDWIGEGGVKLEPRIVRPPESVQPTGQLGKVELGGSHGVQELEGDETLGNWYIEVTRRLPSSQVHGKAVKILPNPERDHRSGSGQTAKPEPRTRVRFGKVQWRRTSREMIIFPEHPLPRGDMPECYRTAHLHGERAHHIAVWNGYPHTATCTACVIRNARRHAQHGAEGGEGHQGEGGHWSGMMNMEVMKATAGLRSCGGFRKMNVCHGGTSEALFGTSSTSFVKGNSKLEVEVAVK